MTEFEHTRVIAAEPRVVFDIASGEPTLNSWTPEGVDVEPAGRGALHAWVASGSEVRDAVGYVDVDRERLRLEWGGTDSGYDGWLQIEPDDSVEQERRSIATLHLTFTGTQPETLGGEVGEEADHRVEQALDRLAALVREQVGA